MTKARTLADNFAADINGITAGTGITGGGTSGTVTITNEMATTITAKGDLLAGTGNAAFDNLAAGASGETLVADSSTTTGLAYREDYAAGKNKIINGDFRINQRVFTSTTSDAVYTFDRWRTSRDGGTVTYSSEAFTLGSAPVSGYESKNFARIVTASQSATSHYAQFIQRIENVRTFAGQTVTLSFWAKASSGTPDIAAESHQSFGSGGSPSSAVFTTFGKTAITTSWARYSLTLAIPSISGKTLGTADDSFLGINFWTSAGSDYNARSSSLGLQNVTIDLWGVQVEEGSVATAFQTATGTLAGELAACQRYYEIGNTYARAYGNLISNVPVACGTGAVFSVPKRVAPTITYGAAVSDVNIYTNTGNTPDIFTYGFNPIFLRANGGTTDYMTGNYPWTASAEL